MTFGYVIRWVSVAGDKHRDEADGFLTEEAAEKALGAHYATLVTAPAVDIVLESWIWWEPVEP